MAKTRPGRRRIHSVSLGGTDTVVKEGDDVTMLPRYPSEAPYVAQIMRMDANHLDRVTVHLRWYYRPEETRGGRLPFHGAKELFLSDHYDSQSVDSIMGVCRVHSLDSYMTLPGIGDDDYYCRYECTTDAGVIYPPNDISYCKCRTPFNPDKTMVLCNGCKEWY